MISPIPTTINECAQCYIRQISGVFFSTSADCGCYSLLGGWTSSISLFPLEQVVLGKILLGDAQEEAGISQRSQNQEIDSTGCTFKCYSCVDLCSSLMEADQYRREPVDDGENLGEECDFLVSMPSEVFCKNYEFCGRADETIAGTTPCCAGEPTEYLLKLQQLTAEDACNTTQTRRSLCTIFLSACCFTVEFQHEGASMWDYSFSPMDVATARQL